MLALFVAFRVVVLFGWILFGTSLSYAWSTEQDAVRRFRPSLRFWPAPLGAHSREPQVPGSPCFASECGCGFESDSWVVLVNPSRPSVPNCCRSLLLTLAYQGQPLHAWAALAQSFDCHSLSRSSPVFSWAWNCAMSGIANRAVGFPTEAIQRAGCQLGAQNNSCPAATHCLQRGMCIQKRGNPHGLAQFAVGVPSCCSEGRLAQ